MTADKPAAGVDPSNADADKAAATFRRALVDARRYVTDDELTGFLRALVVTFERETAAPPYTRMN